MNASRWISAGLLVFAAAATGAWLVQRQETAALRSELTRLRQQNHNLRGVRAEHAQLERERVSAAELKRLRSERAALTWLEIEVDVLKSSVAARRRAADAWMTAASPPVMVRPVALGLNLRMATDGSVLVDGTPCDLAVLEQRLAALGRGARVELRVAVAPAQLDAARQVIRRLLDVANEHGLQTEVNYGPGDP